MTTLEERIERIERVLDKISRRRHPVYIVTTEMLEAGVEAYTSATGHKPHSSAAIAEVFVAMCRVAEAQ